jgi:N4-(beta-N-acetylglucosaminyl)-L-asparaginase
MISRKQFLKLGALGTASIPLIAQSKPFAETIKPRLNAPVVLSTWNFGIAANDAAMQVLKKGGRALDAVEQGVMIPEADETISSVGIGSFPDRDGNVTLDACIMDEKLNCGSVAYVRNYLHPISIARAVMEKTAHVMIVGQGAEDFAASLGMKKVNLLTENMKNEWQKWIKENKYTPKKIDVNNHDTIGMIALDNFGNMSGACTTSGAAWKMAGRVGDSPIIGAGMYCDNAVGGAAATGKGEAVIRICGSFLVVELMRQGMSPNDACKEAVMRLIASEPDWKNTMIGFIALRKDGEVGSYALHEGFQYAVHKDDKNTLVDSPYYTKW